MEKGMIVALGALVSMPVLVAALRHWYKDIFGPLASQDDTERRIAKGSVLVIFVACLYYITVIAIVTLLRGQAGLAVCFATLALWVWTGMSEVEKQYHLLEVLKPDSW